MKPDNQHLFWMYWCQFLQNVVLNNKKSVLPIVIQKTAFLPEGSFFNDISELLSTPENYVGVNLLLKSLIFSSAGDDLIELKIKKIIRKFE